ncbi:MAG: hypothetical protein OSB62_07435 [Alphaproteobacteria bacterium]|nr:hypothetical protein [Alphaproteobacteria bacterium]
MTPETYVQESLKAFKFAYRATSEELIDDLCQSYRTKEFQARLDAGASPPKEEYSQEEQCLREVWSYLEAAHYEQERKGPIKLQYLPHIYMVAKQRQLDGAEFETIVTAVSHDGKEDGFISDKGYKTYISESSHGRRQYEHNMREKVRADIKDMVCNHGFDGERVVDDMDGLTNPEEYPNGMTKLEWQLAHFKTLPERVQRTKIADKTGNSFDSVHNSPPSFGADKLESIIPSTRDMLEAAGNPEAQVALYDVIQEDLELVVTMRRAEEIEKGKGR